VQTQRIRGGPGQFPAPHGQIGPHSPHAQEQVVKASAWGGGTTAAIAARSATTNNRTFLIGHLLQVLSFY
jgi:hypothetical protein